MNLNKIPFLLALTLLACTRLFAQDVSYSALFDNSTFSRSIDLSKPVGAIDGAAGTTPSGAATYTIPIKCPPGTNGMAPQIAIVYNSQGGNGILGQGWSLSGLSVITRVGKDHYHDGKAAPPTYTNEDAFVLDGQRLVPVSGSNGGHETTYSMEAENYSVTTSYGAIGSDPHFFSVRAKDGSIMEYGFSSDSRMTSNDGSKIMVWRLNKIQDINGNYIWFTYDNTDRDSRLVKIAYTGNLAAGLSPYNEINFIYAERRDKSIAYDAGNSLVSKYLLWQIKIKGEGGDLFKTYQFEYGKNNIGASFLKLVEEFASDDSKLNDTRFKYGEATPAMEVKSSNINITYRKPYTDYTNPDIISGDFDGDGKSEMLVAQYDLVDVDYYDQVFNKHYKSFAIYKQSSSTGSDVYVPLVGGSDSWSAAGKHLMSFKQSNSSKSFVVSDFDGDGKDDLFFFRSAKLSGHPPISKMDGTTIYYSRVNSSGFYFDKIDYDPATISMPYGGQPHLLPGKNKVVLGDFDGDKRTDYLYFTRTSEYYGGTTQYTDHSFVSFPGKGELNNRLMQTGTPGWDDEILTRDFMNNDLYVLDFDGDGASELLMIGLTKSYIYKVTKSASGNYLFEYMSELGYPRGDHHDIYGIGDFNADGKDDLITRVKSTNDWEIGFSNGKIFTGNRFDFTPSYMFQDKCDAYQADRLYIGDYNGDGKSDLLHESCDCGNYRTKSTFNAYYFTGVGSDNKMRYTMKSFAYANKALTSPVTEIRPIITDVNGDGKNEISFKTEYDNEMQTLYLNKDDQSNLLEKVTDGFNRTTTFRYQCLPQATTDNNFYTKGNGEKYPVNNAQFPVYVVDLMWTPDGVGGTHKSAFMYENLRLHRTGRGLLGFEKVKSYNTASNMRTEATYGLNRDFYVPYLSSTKTFLNGEPGKYSLSTTEYDFTRLSPWYCYVQTNPSGSSEDLLAGRSSSYTNTYDADGNITNTLSTLSGDVSITTETNSIYTAVGGSSIANAPSEITVTTTRGSSPAVTDKTKLYYDSRGRLIHSNTDPGGVPVEEIIHLKWKYDDYGNKTEESQSCLKSAYKPLTSYAYDPTGRFVIKKTNAVGDYTEYYTDKFWGKPLSVTGLNGLTVAYTYDAWGRLVAETLPVSASASYTRTYRTGWDIGTHQLYYTLLEDPAAPDVQTWYDLLGREVKTQREHVGGAWTEALTDYDARGNVQRKTNEYLPSETPLTTEYTYDERNRLATETSIAGTTRYKYEFSGGSALTTVTLPDGKVKKTKTDAGAKLVESDNGIAGTVQFSYDSRGNELYARMKIYGTGANFVRKEYDSRGRLIRLEDADAGTTTYTYDPFGRLTGQKDANGKTTELTYGTGLGLLQQKKLDGVETNYTYYDKAKGYRLKKEEVSSTPWGTVADEYDYDERGATTRHSRNTNGAIMEKEFSYDDFGRLSTTLYPSGLRTRQHYSADGSLEQITTDFSGGGPGEKLLYRADERRGDGRVNKFTRSNGLQTENEYENGYLLRIRDQSGILDLGMGYDYSNGNPWARADVRASVQETFTYDNADRLVLSEAGKWDASGTLLTMPPIEVQYDKPSPSWTGSFGRIVSKSDAGQYQYHDFPRNGVASITDPANLVNHPAQKITYTPFHKTGRITETIGGIGYEESFVYDAAEDRAYSEQLQGGALQHRRWYMGDYELSECAGSPAQQLHYIAGDAGLSAIVVEEGGSFTYYAAYTDHLGSLVLLTDDAGTPVYRQAYDPWGRERDPETWDYGTTGSGTKPRWLSRGYTGHEMLPEYGLINMNGRMYDPLNGRMLRPDNYVQDPTNTQSYNRYSYCWNSPLKYTDPSGDLVFWALPYLTINKRGIDFGVSVGGGIPGTFGVQGNVSYGTTNNFSASVGVVAGGVVSGNVGWGTRSGFFANAGVGFNLAGMPGFNTNLTSAGVGWSQRGGLYAYGAGITVSQGGEVSFNPSIGYTHSFRYNRMPIRGGESTADITRDADGILTSETFEKIGSMNSTASGPWAYGNGVCPDCLDPSTVGNNLLGLSYPGGNNPMSMNQRDYNYSYVPKNMSEYPAIGHDRRYDNLRIRGASGLFTDTRAIGADWQFVREELAIAANQYLNGNDRISAGILAIGLGLASYAKTYLTLQSPYGRSYISYWYNVSNKGVTNNPSIHKH